MTADKYTCETCKELFAVPLIDPKTFKTTCVKCLRESGDPEWNTWMDQIAEMNDPKPLEDR